MHHRIRRPVAGLVAVLACAAAAPAPAGASGGTYTQMFCANPDTGKGVLASNGVLPDGTTNPASNVFAGSSAVFAKCTGTIDAYRGVPATTGSGWKTTSANHGGALRYRAPAGIRFAGGTIYRHGLMSGNFSWTVSRSGSWNHMFGNPFDDRCSWGAGCSTKGTKAVPWADVNKVAIGAATTEANGFDVSVLCDIPGGAGWSCTSNGSQTVRVFGGKLSLEDVDPPAAGSAIGSLATDATLAANEDLLYTATDEGSGLYRTRLLIDGQPMLSRVVHENGGRCADTNPVNGDDYEFVHGLPCRGSASVEQSFDTRSLPDGPAALRVVVEDAGGNTTPVLARTVTIDNVPPPSVVRAPVVQGAVLRKGSALAVDSGAWDDHGAAGEPEIRHVWQRCAADGSACADAGTGSTHVLGAEDVGKRIRVVETATNREGTGQAASALSAVVTDGDGTLPPGGGGGTGGGSGGGTDNPSGAGGVRLPVPVRGAESSAAGRVNGEGASPRARLSVRYKGRTGRTLTTRYGRGVTVVGRLVDETGRPVRNAIVDVTGTPSVRRAKPKAALPAVTGPDGGFRYRVPASASSRTLRFAYRYLREGAVVSEASLRLKVRAAVKLSVKLRGATVTYAGRVVSGPMPRGGKLVIVQGRPRGGRWQTFASRRAKGRGAFRGSYRLKVRRPGARLQFRARVVAESGWPYLEGRSKAVSKRVR